jgi:hypothetical protein
MGKQACQYKQYQSEQAKDMRREPARTTADDAHIDLIALAVYRRRIKRVVRVRATKQGSRAKVSS